MNFFSKSPLLFFALLLSTTLAFQACNDNNNRRPTGPDFSTVPESYDLSNADTTYTKEGGVEIYVIEKGDCPGGIEEYCTVTSRDQIGLKYTGRIFEGGSGDGEIFESTYADSNTSSALISNLTPNSTSQQSAQIEGFRRGLLGMKQNEKRVIIVPPSLGYNDNRPGVNGMDLRDETLRYDVELTGIQ
ncbi:FKBP-type peptidyl-prolyl cis-trans isomerase [Fodinibius sp. Rm-B-1B1-1]|uniref:FKBP-type peptidyl-prolyl cis-trans isomerase n=1 Tax=Fodinibius alkaliphilus TaxID=3140241 RepID=UPI00315A6160